MVDGRQAGRRRGRVRRVLAAGAVVVAAAALSGCRLTFDIEAVSLNAAGTGTPNGASDDPAFSPDGTKVAFVSVAGNLGPTDTNGAEDVYVRDLMTGTTTLVSVNAAGTGAGNSWSGEPSFSPDGTKVVFSSSAIDLGPPDDDFSPDIFVRDLAAGTTTMVSRNPAGTGSGNGQGYSRAPVFSPTGTAVAFIGTGTDFGPVDPGIDEDDIDVFLHDLSSGQTTLVSRNAAGTDGGNSASDTPVFAPDGTALYFVSRADDLGPVDTNWSSDVFRYDLATGVVEVVSTDASGADSAGGWSFGPVVSPGGGEVAFITDGGDLGPTDTNGGFDVYVHDMETGVNTLVTANAAGTDSGNAPTETFLYFDPAGTRLLFSSRASNLVPGGTNAAGNVFVRDLVAGKTTLVSVNAAGTGSGNAPSGSLGFGRRGELVLFSSAASDLGPTDTNGGWDFYVRDLTTGVTSIISATDNRAGAPNGVSFLQGTATFSPYGNTVVFTSSAYDLVANDRNAAIDVFLARLPRASHQP